MAKFGEVRPALFLAAVWLAAVVADVPQAASQGAPASPAQPSQFRSVLDQYCVTCHNERLKTGGLTLDTVDLANVSAHAPELEKVIRKVRGGQMPPQGMPRPDKATLDSLAASLETALDRVAAGSPNPGRTLLHRLNRAEYANAIRDLLALDVDVAELLPGDDSSFGFDNIADVLRFSPALQERYLSAGAKVSALAVGDPSSIEVTDEVYPVRQDLTQLQHLEGLPLGTRGGAVIRKTFPADGMYEIKAKIWKTNLDTVRGLKHPNKLVFTVDGEEVFSNIIGTPEDQKIAAQPNDIAIAIDARLHTRVPIKAGPHVIGVTFVQSNTLESDILRPFQANVDKLNTDGVPQIDSARISGPYDVTGVGDTPSRRRIFTCTPARPADEDACAREILQTLSHRAYRGQGTDADRATLLAFYRSGRRKGTFDAGIQLALRALLASPAFTFRVERVPANVAAGSSYLISDLELASRLSFFLWSSIPDDELLEVASQGTLRSPGILEQQVKRMLADPKSAALVENFAGQWLYLRNLRASAPNRDLFPDFDDNLRQAFRRETELFFESIMREDRGALELLTADYTFVNERLAKHYGIPRIYGSHFRRVTLTDDARRGLLGKGSMLLVTSRPDRTSPVLRGKWILENILGTPPPPPPPVVPPLPPAGERAKPRTMREQMEQHRSTGTCASCHRLIDPLGFALENFDAVGHWRDTHAGTPIDPSGQLADGSIVDGPVGLRNAILSRPENFVRTLTEKLMTYALGRGLEHYDMPVVRGIVSNAASSNYRFSSLVMGIVTSSPFQMRMKVQEPTNTN